ncbi:MAG: CO dehydrogenase/CO-methylating acetyl-CoA synthase complex subunit beta [Anaerolineae bacterium]|jgi:acetyl-CoA synthase|nr:CO dehydrogenase/CO-methylating acetyl-CoA synthase complex subunit beta [Anaerolineae bacterium]MBT7189268.1 CO dehydrogenase/CO-methylating acetyl-CoA synthase complex subunit beta [Anaerolineae bacterium]MBT7990116.1 CO dehydrogenase/CO-methylating acetyl-CoA synthase complex subunit beta [Anaerolineae bacterium]
MSKYIATRAIRGANSLVVEAETMLQQALAEKGPDTVVEFPNTAYFLPTIFAMTGMEIETLGQLGDALNHARSLLHPIPADNHWTPYLGETLDSGMATLLAAEIIEAIRFIYGLQPEPFPGIELTGGTAYPELDNGGGPAGHLNGPIDDIQLRSWGIQLVDGRMPGFAAIVGAAKDNKTAVKIVRELQQRNILVFLSGNVNGRSIIHQLQEEGIELGYDTYTIPFGTDTISAIYALGFAARSALTFGGIDAGQARDILLYNKKRVFAFVLALGEVDDLKYAAAAGAINFGFPVIADTVIPEILPTGVTDYEHVISMPFEEIEGADDMERAERLVQKCIEVRGVKIKMTEVPVPIPYGSAFEGEVVRKNDMRVEFGGKYSRCFEFLQMKDMDEVTDGVVQIIGPNFDDLKDKGAMDLGIVVEVAGRKLQEDFEPVLERQIHYFVNGGSGLQHIGQRDIAWIRISTEAVEKGFTLEHIGTILHARLHAEFGTIIDKVKVTLYTDPDKVTEWLEKAREAYDFRNKRLADLTDNAVDEFYSCTLCQSFAPNHVCIVSPERLGLCGAYNWLDCKASFSINPTGPNQPIQLGKLIDPEIGYWSGTLDYANVGSHGVITDISMYSIMENPMTACGCFECIVMYVPEVEGVFIVSREDTGMTPMGMKFSTLAGMAGGGMQTPGVMGIGKFYLISPKFISADGGFKRVVWMSKNLKDSMSAEFQGVADREGIPDLIERIADSENVTTVEELVEWVKEKDHPVLDMGPMVAKSARVDGADDVIAQAKAVVEAAVAKEEIPAADVEPEPSQPEPAPVVETPPASKVVKQPSVQAESGSLEDRVDRLERSVKTLIGSLVGALAELGGDVPEVQIAPQAAPVAVAPIQKIEAEAPPKIELAPDKPWLTDDTKTEILKENWTGVVREIQIGATAADGGTRTSIAKVGGETAMPFMDFEGAMPNKPLIAIEIKDRRPDDWSELLLKEWGDALNDPGTWAKAAEEAGADLLQMTLSLTDVDGNPTKPEAAVAAVRKVLDTTGLPLMVFGPGQVDIDNELMVPIADAFKGERLLLGLCEDKNYRTIVASAMANGHLVNARTAMDVNLAKQLNILINDMGLPLDRIIMDPTTGALGYGFEYGYSVMERLRMAALQGDSMTQMPMLVTPGEECWKTKEAKVGTDIPETWGDWLERSITWETLTSVMLLEAGADIVTLRHPESLRRTGQAINDLMGK